MSRRILFECKQYIKHEQLTEIIDLILEPQETTDAQTNILETYLTIGEYGTYNWEVDTRKDIIIINVK